MPCSECERDVPIENQDTGMCATCNKEARDDSPFYPIVRVGFLEIMIKNDEVCPVTGVPITLESDIHHIQGRVGYADEWARQNGITRLVDVRFFLAVSRKGHNWIEDPANRKAAMAKGWIQSREQR